MGSVIFARRPGDGSAREQAASCQRVLGGCANICYEYATKRYRSNCINWGMVPFTVGEDKAFECETGDMIYVPNIRKKIIAGDSDFPAVIVTKNGAENITLHVAQLTDEEKQIMSDAFAEKYEGRANEFIDFISDREVASPGGYRDTWRFIKEDVNSLNRHSNMHLIFSE